MNYGVPMCQRANVPVSVGHLGICKLMQSMILTGSGMCVLYFIGRGAEPAMPALYIESLLLLAAMHHATHCSIAYLTLTRDGTRESNTRYIQWDDGSESIMLGDEVLNLDRKTFTHARTYLYAVRYDVIEGQAHFHQRATVAPASVNSKIHKRLKMTVSAAAARRDKVRLASLLCLCFVEKLVYVDQVSTAAVAHTTMVKWIGGCVLERLCRRYRTSLHRLLNPIVWLLIVARSC